MALLQCTEWMMNAFGLSSVENFEEPLPIQRQSNARTANLLVIRWKPAPLTNTLHTSSTCSKRLAGIVPQEDPYFNSNADQIAGFTYKFYKRNPCQLKPSMLGRRPQGRKLNAKHLLMPVSDRENFERARQTKRKRTNVMITKDIGSVVDLSEELKEILMPQMWMPCTSKEPKPIARRKDRRQKDAVFSAISKVI